MRELKSSIPGFISLPYPSEIIKGGNGYLHGRKLIDGAEGLWRINNSLYDLNDFAKYHPGGCEWINLTRDTDITELFQSHHLSNKANVLLPKYYIRNAKSSRSIPITFDNNGFYNKFKQRAIIALKNVDYHNPSLKTNLIADLLFIMTLLSCIAAVKTQLSINIIISAIGLTWTTISGHNYFHMRDNFRMYYFDISLMSSKDWRITHVMSHHMYPNTLWDYEIYAFEPFLYYFTIINKTQMTHIISILLSPFVWFLTFYLQGIKRYVRLLLRKQLWEFRDIVPFIIPILMSIVSMNILKGFTIWLIIIGISSTIFHFIGLNAAHHHPDIFHDGDISRDNLDWGLLELDTVRGRHIIDDSIFLILTNFGSHGLHHLLPTVDHSYLSLCSPAFKETCREFNINYDNYSQLQLIIGQFLQLGRSQPRNNIK